MLFTATLLEPGQPAQSASVELLPLRSERLAALARGAGFERVALAGGFDGSPHTPDSFLTILTVGA